MSNFRSWVIGALSILLFQSCSIVHYQVRNELHDPSDGFKGACNIQYFVSVEGIPRQITRTPTYDEERLKKDKDEYRHATQEILTQKGCTAEVVETEKDANLKIHIIISPFWSALPQEWLTGLSFGLIPSWGTRPGEYVYVFEDKDAKKGHSYFIDQKTYNHLILFPLIWVNWITPDRIDAYQKALTNFMESSETRDPAEKLSAGLELFDHYGYPLPAEGLIHEAIEIYQKGDKQIELAEAYRIYGFFFRSEGIEKWQSFYEERGFKDPSATVGNRYEKSIEYFEKAKAIWTDHKKFDALTNVYLNMGFTYELAGKRKEACRAYEESIRSHHEFTELNPGSKTIVPYGYNNHDDYVNVHKKRLGCE
jgi:tetratricopeptide (TPR) repeat protein